MRDIDVIDRELRLLAVIRAGLREYCTVSSTTTMDRLLDERLLLSTASTARQGTLSGSSVHSS